MEYAILNDDYSITPTDDMISAYNVNEKKHLIKQEYVGDYFVSSIFLPLNHNHGYGSPIHFECYVFPAKEGEVTSFSEVWGRRAGTYNELMKYHDEAVKIINEKGFIEYGDDA